MGFPGGSAAKNLHANAGRCRFGPWVQKIPWRRKWQPTPIFLPGKFHGRRSLEGYSPWGRRVRHTEATEHAGMLPLHMTFGKQAVLNNIISKDKTRKEVRSAASGPLAGLHCN